MAPDPRISLVLPTYNEAASLERLVGEVASAFEAAGCSAFEIIIVDDASPDGTGAVAERLAARAPERVRIVHRSGRLGLASAVLAGWQVARAPVLAVMDADGQHPAWLPAALLKEVEQGADLAVASRHAPGGHIPQWSVTRRVFSRGAAWLARLALPDVVLGLRDPLSGCFALRREVIAGRGLQPAGYKILLEVLARGHYRSLVEVPYSFAARRAGASKAGVREALAYLRHLGRLARARRAGRRLLAWALVAAAAAVLLSAVAENPVDYRVYYHASRSLMAGRIDLYADDFSPMRWPMNYKYPPWFVLAFVPFVLLPFTPGAVLWAGLKFAALVLAAAMTRRLIGQGRDPGPLGACWFLPVLIVAPSLVREFRYGNIHFFLFAATVAALYFLPRRPGLSGGLFAFGILTKLFPLFFLPYLFFRRLASARLAAGLLAGLLVFALLPAVYFGFAQNAELHATWLLRSSLPDRFPGGWGATPDHSLRSVLTRYLSEVDYAGQPDFRYENINVVDLPRRAVVLLWVFLAAAGCAAIFLLAYRRGRAPGASRTLAPEYGLLFCALLLFAPFTHEIYLVALLFPALVLAYELKRLPAGAPGRAGLWALALVIVALFAVPPLIPGREWQRLLTVYSPQCWGTLLLAGTMVALLRRRLREVA